MSTSPLKGTKILIVGCTGSGKSTLSETLSIHLSLPYLCLDALSHQPHWQDTPPDLFRQHVSTFLEANPRGWVIDGNYITVLRGLTWETASDIIWLDYPIYIVLWRLFFRTMERIRGSVKLWGMEGCVETWRSQFFSRDSLLYRPLFWKYRRPQFYESLVRKEKGRLEGVNVIWLRSSKETDEFLRSVGGKIHGEIMEISQEEKDAAVL